MHILITGNLGYVGPILVEFLRRGHPAWTLTGVDTAYFAHCLTTSDAVPERFLDRQIYADVRDPVPPGLLQQVDAVVYLAAISNDPMGNAFRRATEQVNHRAALTWAEAATAAGVGRFVFASSCSVYGAGGELPRSETAPLQPLTPYARSKVAAEEELANLASRRQHVTCLRFATACGLSPRLRLDLVLNDFVASAVARRHVSILSDGTPWRPLIHVQDMARAIEWALLRDGDAFLAVNAGRDDWNYTIRALAEAVAAEIPGTGVEVNADAPPDRRTYRVDFCRFRELAPQHQPTWDLSSTVRELAAGLERLGFADPEFRESDWMRLSVLSKWVESGQLDDQLRWVPPPP